jgi:hypothetical protein
MGTDLWTKTIKKEMKIINVAFEFCEDDLMPVGYQHIDCHMLKIMLEHTKAQYVAGGHQTEPAKDIKFASVVTRKSIRIAVGTGPRLCAAKDQGLWIVLTLVVRILQR